MYVCVCLRSRAMMWHDAYVSDSKGVKDGDDER